MANSNFYDYPTDTPIADENGMVTPPWGQWFNRTHAAALSVQQSGPTTERPAQRLWIGRFFYDLTLGKPVWVHQVKPVVVWHDASGAPA